MSRKQVFLVGIMKNQITGGKLPSKRDILSVLFYNMRVVNLSLQESASLVIDECLIYWKKARIPTHHRSDCIAKCKKLYTDLRNLEKHKARTSELNKNKRKEFEDGLNDLFDIAHADALSMIKIDEDKQFLIAQRIKGRQGCMLGVDTKQTKIEKKKMAKEEKLKLLKEKQQSILEPGMCYIINKIF